MVVALLNDSHFGARPDFHEVFHDQMKKFLDTQFFPYVDANNIKTIVHLGDLFDKRRVTNNYTLYRVRKDYLEPLAARNVEYHQLLGNHDVFYKNTNEVSSTLEVLAPYQKLYGWRVYDKATEVELEGVKVLFVPWICDDNRDYTLKAIQQTDAEICLGHLELAGFEANYAGAPPSEGDDPKLFEKFDIVVSGHYHHKSNKGNIDYLGSQVEFNWNDCGDAKGFHVFNMTRQKAVFVPNNRGLPTMFKKLTYDNGGEVPDGFVTGCFVKVDVKAKDDPAAFEKFIAGLENQNPLDLQIIEQPVVLKRDDLEDVIAAKDNFTIFQQTVQDSTMSDGLKQRVIEKLAEIYQLALEAE